LARDQTFETRSGSCDFHVFGNTRVHFFERKFNDVLMFVTNATWSTSAATEHLFENVTHIRSGSTLWRAILSKLVVACSGIVVAQSFVSLTDFLEFFGVTAFVGVIFTSQGSVRLFNIIY
jgi:hypothetical protein